MDWRLFLSTFGLIFVAELPDKTALLSVLMASRQRPLGVFIGACLAFVVQSLVAVSFGSFIGILPSRYVHVGAGILFLILAVMMWRRKDKDDDGASAQKERPTGGAFLRIIVTAFLGIFVAEWGDLTQIATATLAAKYHSPFTIFASATLALWSVTGIAVVVGHHAKKR